MNADPNDRLLPVPRRTPPEDERFSSWDEWLTDDNFSLVGCIIIGLWWWYFGPPDWAVKFWVSVKPGLDWAFFYIIEVPLGWGLIAVVMFIYGLCTVLPLQIFCGVLVILWILRKPWRQLLDAIRSRP